eukprot:3100671-Amphidinium_carterae.1
MRNAAVLHRLFITLSFTYSANRSAVALQFAPRTAVQHMQNGEASVLRLTVWQFWWPFLQNGPDYGILLPFVLVQAQRARFAEC